MTPVPLIIELEDGCLEVIQMRHKDFYKWILDQGP